MKAKGALRGGARLLLAPRFEEAGSDVGGTLASPRAEITRWQGRGYEEAPLVVGSAVVRR
jgi:hypothetical protein